MNISRGLPYLRVPEIIQMFCAGDEESLGGSKLTVEGGIISENEAFVRGGAIATGAASYLNISGGLFRNNFAK